MAFVVEEEWNEGARGILMGEKLDQERIRRRRRAKAINLLK